MHCVSVREFLVWILSRATVYPDKSYPGLTQFLQTTAITKLATYMPMQNPELTQQHSWHLNI